MISLELGATYDGMTVDEVMKEFVEPMRAMGMTDEMINEILQTRKDKTDMRGEE